MSGESKRTRKQQRRIRIARKRSKRMQDKQSLRKNVEVYDQR